MSMENLPNFMNESSNPKERKYIKKFGLQNVRNYLISKCGVNIGK